MAKKNIINSLWNSTLCIFYVFSSLQRVYEWGFLILFLRRIECWAVEFLGFSYIFKPDAIQFVCWKTPFNPVRQLILWKNSWPFYSLSLRSTSISQILWSNWTFTYGPTTDCLGSSVRIIALQQMLIFSSHRYVFLQVKYIYWLCSCVWQCAAKCLS